MPSNTEQDDARQRMHALSAAQQPILGWIAGARALALLSAAIDVGDHEKCRELITQSAEPGGRDWA